jgi:hypothetical protein
MAKGPSPLRAKMAAYRARPYTDAQRMNYERCDCEPRFLPSQRTLDAAADFALTGGFKTGKSNICPDCREARSVSGACGC